MDNLKVGIIGLGGIARSHCDAIETLDNVEIIAVADLIEEKRREYMGKYDIPQKLRLPHRPLERPRNRRCRHHPGPSTPPSPHR